MSAIIEQIESCCGCAGCALSCPRQAVTMKPDGEGFLYPTIDKSRCTGCGLCQEVCAFRKRQAEKPEGGPPSVYAAKHKDGGVLRRSTSGGVFTAFSDVVLANGGAVYGAVFDGDFTVRHVRADAQAGRDAMRGSKYVQSDPGAAFLEAEADLRAGRTVLYTGTPCQTDALRLFLKQRAAPDGGLVLCDLVCHGVPSPALWAAHTAFLQKKRKSPLKDYRFRSKELGWNHPVERGVYRGGKTDFRSILSQKQTRLFYLGHTIRPSCFACPYAAPLRSSDVTLADYAGIDGVIEGFNDGGGVSLVLVHTPKGEALLKAAADDLTLKVSSLEDCVPHQPNLRAPTEKPRGRDAFWALYRQAGYRAVLKKYTNYNMKGRLKWMVRRLLGKQY